jgi:hypothetical protein
MEGNSEKNFEGKKNTQREKVPKRLAVVKKIKLHPKD